MLEEYIIPIYNTLVMSSFLAFLSAFGVSLAKVTGFKEYVAIRSNRFFYKLLCCDFCLSFWVLVFLSLLGVMTTHTLNWVIVPFLGTPLSKILLK